MQCANQVPFNISASSTYVDGGDDSGQFIDFSTGLGVDPVINDDYNLLLVSPTIVPNWITNYAYRETQKSEAV